MFCDYHVHTAYSDDSVYPMEEVVKDAIAMGMRELCFTDHVDYGVKPDCEQLLPAQRHGKLYNVDYPAYVKEINELRQRYGDRITLRMGMEFGVQTHTVAQYEKLFHRFPFDFIILSCHQVEDQEFWTQDFQKGRTQQEYNERYYQEIWEVIRRYTDYSVLGHLDLIARYDKAGVYPFAKVKDRVAQILRQVIADGKGIEVNTSSHRYGIHDLTPSKAILRLYRELGGTILTIGSDSHKPEHLGAYIEETKALLKEIGFTHYHTFERMRPIAHLL